MSHCPSHNCFPYCCWPLPRHILTATWICNVEGGKLLRKGSEKAMVKWWELMKGMTPFPELQWFVLRRRHCARSLSIGIGAWPPNVQAAAWTSPARVQRGAVAPLLEVQSGIHWHHRIHPQTDWLLGLCSYIAMISTWCYDGVTSRRTKTMPQLQGRWWRTASGCTGVLFSQLKWTLAPLLYYQLK